MEILLNKGSRSRVKEEVSDSRFLPSFRTAHTHIYMLNIYCVTMAFLNLPTHTQLIHICIHI